MATRLLLLWTFVSIAWSAPGPLRAGAARVDITPAPDAALPMSGYSGRTEGFKGIHDRLYARAVAVDDGSAQAAIVTMDLSSVPHAVWERISARVARETGIPRERLLLAATHTHGAPTPTTLKTLDDHVIEAIRQAQAKLEPVRVGYGVGKASVNINRRARTDNGGWWLGRNPDGPSDKTVAVVKFESLAGRPIALFVNYAVHGVVLGPQNYDLTADLPGATSRHIERQFTDQVVALWTSGAAGDQNPIYGPGNSFSEMTVLGQLLAEEALKVAAGIKTSPAGRVAGVQKLVTCPGKRYAPGPTRRRDLNYEFLDADPTDIRLSALRVGHVIFAGVSGEVLTLVGERLKNESPFARTIVITHCNGSSGYLPDDAAYDQISYEIVVTRVKRGCAENAIVEGLLDLMDQL